MYHTTKIAGKYQHRRRFSWTKCKTNICPERFMTSVSFGDQPVRNIATIALRKTAEMSEKISLECSQILEKRDVFWWYNWQFWHSRKSRKYENKYRKDYTTRRFKTKKWLTSWNDPSTGDKSMLNNVDNYHNEKLLGMQWDAKEDVFKFAVHLNFWKKRRGVHLSPELFPEQLKIETQTAMTQFTVKAKTLMMKLWQ